MRSCTDINSVRNIIKQDIEDTTAHLWELYNILQQASGIIESIKIYGGVEMQWEEFTAIVQELIEGIGDEQSTDWTQGWTLCGENVLHVKRKYEEIDPSLAHTLHCVTYVISDTHNHEKTIEMFLAYENGHWDAGQNITVDGEYVDVDGTCFEDLTLNDISLLSYISNLKEGIQMNSFLTDMNGVLKNPSSFQLVINKWNSNHNATSRVKDAVMSAMGSVDGTQASVLSWLQQTYDNMKGVSVVDGELSFSSTDFVARVGFTTVAKAVLSVLGATVAAIALAINKIAGIIVYLTASVVGAIGNALSERANPLIKMKDNAHWYNDFLPIPILQETASSEYPYNIPPVEGQDDQGFNARLNTYLATFRVFRNKGQNSANYEAFLRCDLGPYDIRDFMTYIASGAKFPGKRFNGLDEDYDYILRVIDDDSTSFHNNNYILDFPYEENQANYVVAHLILFYRQFLHSDAVSSDSGSTCFNAIKNDVATPGQLNKFISILIDWFAGIGVQNSVFSIFYSNSFQFDYDLNWGFVINHLLPAMRRNMQIHTAYGDVDVANYLSIDSIKVGDVYTANANFENYQARPRESWYTMWVDEIVNQSDSPYVIPKYTGAGFVLNLVLSMVTIAAVTAVAIVATLKYKSWARRKANTQVTKLTDLRAFNDAVQKDPNYTKADKLAANKMYDKACRSYNRWSWIWGGGTWSETNGWLDYSSAPVSSSNISEVFTSGINDPALLVSPTTSGELEEANIANTADIETITDQVSDTGTVSERILKSIVG